LNGDRVKNCFSVDCTLGFGGHSSEIIKRLISLKNWRHVGIDQDVVEIAKTKQRIFNSLNVMIKIEKGEKVVEKEGQGEKQAVVSSKEQVELDLIMKRISFQNQNFGNLEELLIAKGSLGKVDILLADLGYSSMQIDDPLRGFTYKSEGPLDMRMSADGETALEFLKRVKRNDLKKILEENSDEVMALQIATALKEEPIPETTTALSERVRKTYKASLLKQGSEVPSKEDLDSAVARTMQAIRIEVNGEFRVLEKLLEALPRVLAPGGRVVFLTFHSGEDRRVKKALKDGFNKGIYTEWSREVVRANSEERRSNPRSKCAKLRWAIVAE
jgi:16S rRNA (cytosine1402-N4)-methyltransferase